MALITPAEVRPYSAGAFRGENRKLFNRIHAQSAAESAPRPSITVVDVFACFSEAAGNVAALILQSVLVIALKLTAHYCETVTKDHSRLGVVMCS
jgi:hypothetical protein